MSDELPQPLKFKRKRRKRALNISWKFPALIGVLVIVGYVVTQGDPTGLLNGIIPGPAPQQAAAPPPQQQPFPAQPPANMGAPPMVAHGAPAAGGGAPAATDPALPAVQAFAGSWTTEKGSLMSPADGTARVLFVEKPPEEFTISMKVRRLSGDNTFAIGVPFGDRQVLVCLDAQAGSVSGLEAVDGRNVGENDTTRRGRQLLPEKEMTVECTVRKTGISCLCNGQYVFAWRGESKRLSLPNGFDVPDNKALFLASVGSRFAIRDIVIRPLASAPGLPAAEKVHGAWTTENGSFVSPTEQVGRIQFVNHPPQEFTVSLKVRRLSGDNTFGIGVPIADRQVLVCVDAFHSTVSGLEVLDGKNVSLNEARVPAKLLEIGKEVAVECTVRNTGITLSCDGQKVVDWQGHPQRLQLTNDFWVPDNRALFLASESSQFAIRDISVRPAGKDPTRTPDAATAGDAAALPLPATRPVRGSWRTEKGSLNSPADGTALVEFVKKPPAEFTLTLTVRRLSGDNTFAMGVPIDGRQVLVCLDAHAGNVSGLESLDGRNVSDNEATHRGRLLEPQQDVTVECTVRKTGITCICDGIEIIHWRGKSQRLSLPGDFAVPDKKALFLATIGSKFAIRDITIAPAAKEPAGTQKSAPKKAPR